MGLSYEIQYKKGVENIAVDALSRNFEEADCCGLSVVQPKWATEIMESYNDDKKVHELVAQLCLDPNSHPDIQFQQGILRHQGQIWVGSNGQLRSNLISELHPSPLGGHSGVHATQQMIRQLFYWPSLLQDVKNFVKECEMCQRCKGENTPYLGLLQPIPIPNRAWEHLAIDFISGLPKSKGRDSILVVIDRYTKFAQFFALTHPYDATIISQVFLNNVCKLHELPSSYVSDRDPIFLSTFWRELFKSLQVQLKPSTAYHPQTDGQSEKLNKCVEAYLRCMTGHKPSEWSKWLSLAEFWYNSNFQSAIGMTPFKALYGYEPPQPSFELIAQSKSVEVDQMLRDRQLMSKVLHDNLTKAQNRMKHYADAKRRKENFEICDWVFLKLQPYCQTSGAVRRNLKLSARFFGSYEVIRKIGTVAYEFRPPAGSKIHPIFHVSQLKKKVGDKVIASHDPPYCTSEG